MITYEVSEKNYNPIHKYIAYNSRHKPLCPIEELDIQVDNSKQIVFFIFDKKRKIHLLYALESIRHFEYKYITDSDILISLFKLLEMQAINKDTDNTQTAQSKI